MITQALCNVFKLEMVDVHAGDEYKIALYSSTATLNKQTTQYTPANEVPASGTYVAGGAVLQKRVALLDGDVAILDFENPQWIGATIVARGALIYNATRGNKAVAVLDFGQDVMSTSGTFQVWLPPATAKTALVRVG